MSQPRRLAAILFTDIEGYSALVQQDEKKSKSIRDQHRQVVSKEHETFNGSIIQFYGDGTLSIFHSAVEAVRCALAMQLAFRQQDVPVRMGLHMGEVVFDSESVFGDSVNIASRIESLGVAGCVLLSDRVEAEIHNHVDLKTISVGVYQFKNIDRNVEVYALDHEELVKPAPQTLKGKTAEKNKQPAANLKKTSAKSIAVLPFKNMSNDPEQEYFGEGMAEEIINSLVHINDLKVAGRMSSFQFKDPKSNLQEIGEKLGVNNVLEGSIRKQGSTIRVMVQLINVEDGFQLWGEKFDRQLDDIFAIQDEIALSITEKLKVTLLKEERNLISRSRSNNSAAYDLYLKGRFYIIRRGAYVLTAMEYYQKAITIDPEFALAYAGLADANLLLATYGLGTPKQLMTQAKVYAEKAITLNPELCEPYCSLAYYYTCYEWNWVEAKKNFIQSLELNPRYNEVHLRYGFNYLCWVEGNFEEAEKHGEAAIMVEPLHSISFGTYSLILHAAGKFDKALEICKAGIDLDANSFICRLNEGNIYMALHQYEDAAACYESALQMTNRHHFMVAGLITAYCAMNQIDKALELMAELKQRATKEYISCTFLGTSAAQLNNLTEAFDYLEMAYTNREPVLLAIKYEHWVPYNVKQDSRFKDLLKRIGFPRQKNLVLENE